MKSLIFITLFLTTLSFSGEAPDTITGGGALPKATSENQCLISGAGPLFRFAAGSCSAGAGDVVGPAGSITDNALPRFDATTGEILQGSAVIVDDSNNMSGVGTLSSGVITQSGTTLANTYVVLGASTDNRLVRRDGTAGQIQGSGITVDDSDNVTGVVGFTSSGVVGLAAGLVGTPSLARSNDLNTGIYFPSADSIAITAGGVAAITVDSSQRTLFGAQVQIGDGSVGAPGIAFINDTDTGIYYTSTPEVIVAVAGANALRVQGSTLIAAGAITSGGVAVPTISSSSTLTNKTIDSDDNSISDLNTADIKAGDNLLKRDYCGHIRTGANETVYLVLDASEPFSANSVTTDLTSGSITMAVQNDGVSLTSCSAISVTTTETETDCSDTVVAADEDLTLVFTSNSSAVDIRVCVHGVKT